MDSKIFLGKYRVPAEEIESVGKLADSALAYEAEEIDSGKKVVVEVVPAASLNAAERERAKAQAMAAKALNHVNIAALYDFGVQDDRLVYVTEDFEGTTAEEWIKANGPMPVGPVLRIASQVVSALSAAAFHGIVHRAINPGNLVLVPGQTAQGEWPLVKVLHFVGGAPKISGSDLAVTAFDKSTPYASPEQRERGTVDFRAEIYSLGGTMSFLLRAIPPRMTPNGTEPTPTTKPGLTGETKTALPKKIGDLLAQMLSTNPEARPPDPLAFYRMLQDCLTEAEARETKVRAFRTPAPRSEVIDVPRPRRFPFKSLVRAATCLAMAAVTALVLRGYLKHRPIVRAEQPTEAPTNAFASATPAEMKPTDTTVAIAPLPTAAVVDGNTPSVTIDSVETDSTKQIATAPGLTTPDPQPSPPPQETGPVVRNDATNSPTPIESSEVAAAPQVEIAPAPAKSRDAELSEVALQSPPKEIKTPEVRRAEPYDDEPEVRRAELARSNQGPAEVEPDRPPPPSQLTNSRAKTEPIRRVEAEATPTTALVLKRIDSAPEVAPTSSAGKMEQPIKPRRQVDEKIYLLPGSEFESPPTGRLPRGSVRGRFLGETPDGKWMFELPSREIVTVVPPSHR
jgi:serine/threonine-protein kinase